MTATSEEVRDLPCFEFRTTVVVELYRVRCPDWRGQDGESAAVAEQGPFSKRFEEGGGLACESAAVRRVARQSDCPGARCEPSDLRYLRRWAEGRRKPDCGRWEWMSLSGEEAKVSHGGE